MKRFFCIKCKAIRRVRKMPYVIDIHGELPSQRVGECNWHALESRKTFKRDQIKSFSDVIARTNVKSRKVGSK